jgi:hypothetical protein
MAYLPTGQDPAATAELNRVPIEGWCHRTGAGPVRAISEGLEPARFVPFG